MNPSEIQSLYTQDMVRVISCHHFVSQDVFTTDLEPVALCPAQEKLLVATALHTVEVRELDQRGHLLHTFPTVDLVRQLVYCDVGNYVATLERKSSRHSSPITNVRVYMNWWVDMKGQPMRVRIAGCVTPSSQSSCSQLEMVELPLNNPVSCIACCKQTGTLAASHGKLISVFSFTAKVHDISKQHFHDFDHLFDIRTTFVGTELAICEDTFASLSKNQIQIFKISFEQDDDNMPVATKENEVSNGDPHSRETRDNYFVVDENHVEWQFESGSTSSPKYHRWYEGIKEVLHPASFPLTIHLRSIDHANSLGFVTPHPDDVLGPAENVQSCPIEIIINPKFDFWNGFAQACIHPVVLLCRHFSFSQDALQGLHLLPIYAAGPPGTHQLRDPLSEAVACEESPHTLPNCPLRSRLYSRLKGLGCFFTSSEEGYLYDLMESTRFVCLYPYTAAVKSIAVEHDLLHVLTETGLETYTLRMTHRVVRHVEVVDDFSNTCPSSSEPVCLVGLRPFLGVEQLVMSDRYLVLVSSTDDTFSSTESIEGNGCTLYSLRKPTAQQLFHDLLEMGQFHRSSSPSTYHHLLMEGHMILRTQLLLQNEARHHLEILDMYRNSCAMLADYFVCSEYADEHKFAAPYYNMSKLSVEAVVQRVLELRHEVKLSSAMKGLVQYLDLKLLHQRSSDVTRTSQVIAEIILDIYAEEAPEKLCRVILLSGLASYKLDKAIQLLRKRVRNKKGSAGDILAYVVLLLHKGNTESCQNTLMSVGKDELVSVLLEFHELLWEGKRLSPVGKLIKQVRSDAFLEFMLSMLQKQKKSVDFFLTILQNDAQGAELHCIPLLKPFLESVLCDPDLSSYVTRNITVLLIQIYLNRLESALNGTLPTQNYSFLIPGSGTKPGSFFSSRHAWLNELPPYRGKGPGRTCFLMREKKERNGDNPSCLCFGCTEDLLRLQSLLCSPLFTSEVQSHVQRLLATTNSLILGYFSLRILSTEDQEETLLMIMNGYPYALLTYAREAFQENTESWCTLFKMLQRKLGEAPPDSPSYGTLLEVSEGILSHLSEILHPAEFIPLIPTVWTEKCKPHIKRSIEKNQATILRQKIVSLGLEIKSMM